MGKSHLRWSHSLSTQLTQPKKSSLWQVMEIHSFSSLLLWISSFLMVSFMSPSSPGLPTPILAACLFFKPYFLGPDCIAHKYSASLRRNLWMIFHHPVLFPRLIRDATILSWRLLPLSPWTLPSQPAQNLVLILPHWDAVSYMFQPWPSQAPMALWVSKYFMKMFTYERGKTLTFGEGNETQEWIRSYGAGRKMTSTMLSSWKTFSKYFNITDWFHYHVKKWKARKVKI